MALASNVKEQLAKRLQADIVLREPSWSVTPSVVSTASLVPAIGDPMLTIMDASAAVIAVCAITRRSFAGFNVVAELSSSAAEGLPEHIACMIQLSTNSQIVTSKLAMFVHELGASSMQIGFDATPAEADLTAAKLATEIPNSARLGASGQ